MVLEKIVDKVFRAIDNIPIYPDYNVGAAREDTAILLYLAKYIVIDVPVGYVKCKIYGGKDGEG